MNEVPCNSQTCGKSLDLEPSPLNVDEQELADLCKALGHPARIRIMKILIEHQNCICGDIVAGIPLAQSTVSQHLKQLKDAGLIQGEIDGPRICYCVNPQNLKRLKVLIAGL